MEVVSGGQKMKLIYCPVKMLQSVRGLLARNLSYIVNLIRVAQWRSSIIFWQIRQSNMGKHYGIKVSRPGFDVNSATPAQLAFSSKYQTFKIHSRGSGTVNSNSGGGLATIPHGLGYVPAFFVHVDYNQAGSFTLAPYGVDGDPDFQLLYAYADSTNLYIKAKASVNSLDYGISSDNNMYRQGGGFEADGGATIGRISSTDWSGALRFDPIVLAQGSTVDSATLRFYCGDVNAGSFADMVCKGIDEDDTDVFNNPFSRTTTTASTSVSGTVPSAGNYFNITVTNQVNEIIARSGWASGNAMGFTIVPTGSGATGSAFDDQDATNSYLNIVQTIHTVGDYKYTILKNQIE